MVEDKPHSRSFTQLWLGLFAIVTFGVAGSLLYRHFTFQTEQRLPDGAYNRLSQLLESQQWQAADEETIQLIQQATGLKEKLIPTDGDIATALRFFPCGDLRRMDEVWIKNSQGKFGFTTQSKIYQEVVSQINSNDQMSSLKIVGEFEKRIGRKTAESNNYSLQAPAGHLPSWGVFWTSKLSNRSPFLTDLISKRSQQCNLL